jgi:threonine/homoserine/homoserine lactone efflux protein
MIIFFVFLSKIINSLPTLFLIILLNGFFYLIFLFIFDKQRLFKEARIIFRSIKEQ